MHTNSLCLPIPNQRLSLIRVVLAEFECLHFITGFLIIQLARRRLQFLELAHAEELSRSLCHSFALVHQVSKLLDLSDFVCAQVNSYTHDGTLRKLL